MVGQTKILLINEIIEKDSQNLMAIKENAYFCFIGSYIVS